MDLWPALVQFAPAWEVEAREPLPALREVLFLPPPKLLPACCVPTTVD